MDIDDTLKLDDVARIGTHSGSQQDYGDYTPRSTRFDDKQQLEFADGSDTDSQRVRGTASIADVALPDSPGSPSHVAVVRSRSSYSFQNMGTLLTIPNLLRFTRNKQLTATSSSSHHTENAGHGSTVTSTSIIQGVGSTSTAAVTATSSTTPAITDTLPSMSPVGTAEVVHKKEDDGFLQETQNHGFIGFYSHPLTKSYLLMFFLWRGFEDLLFFRMEAEQYRFEYQSLYNSARKAHAYRIYNTFLSRNAVMYILKRATPREMTILKAIQVVKANVDKHSATLFDDVAFFVLQWMEDIFYGHHDSASEYDTNNRAYMAARDQNAPNFYSSVFYQALSNDLHGCKTVSTLQYMRLAERVSDLPPYIFDSHEASERTVQTLENFGIDFDHLRRNNTAASLVRKNSTRTLAPSGRSRTVTPIESTRRREPADNTGTDGPMMIKDWKKGSTNALSSILNMNENAHVWVQHVGDDQQFCEYCCKSFAFGKGAEDSNAPYHCESCGFMCHRSCRNYTIVSCIKQNTLDNIDDKNELNSERVRKLEEKIQAMQKEIDIEEKIKLGLDNFVAAKKKLGKVKTSPTKKVGQNTQEIETQLERSKKNLDILREQQQKCKLQRAALLSAAQQSHEAQVSEVLHEEVSAGESENEVVRIISMDSAMKASSTKTFVISPNTTIKQLIRLALDKFLLPGVEEDYGLSYLSDIGEVPMRLEEMPIKLSIDLMTTPLKLRLLNPVGEASGGLTKEEEKQLRKQREVLMEICETEIAYTEDLSNILILFLDPMTKAEVITPAVQSEIFSNIIALSSLHDRIVQEIEDKKMDKQGQYLNVGETVEIYKRHISRFSAYEEYCGNQNNARRKLNKMRADPTFLKFLQQCEASPKLHKLGLADLLVKPMHRITRYPIFFKRLLTHVNKGGPDYAIINDLINHIELMVANVNESVRQHESSYRIRYIDDNIDFGNVVERFKIANGRRELISEKQLTYVKKNTNATIDVIVLFFTDIIMLVKHKKFENFTLFKPPIPLESAAFLDKPDSLDTKNCFQIVHVGSEIHTFFANTAYDKTTWLHEAESIRAQYCAIHHDFEVNIMKDMVPWYEHLAMQQLQENAAAADALLADVDNGNLSSPSISSSSPISARRRFTSSPIKADKFSDNRQRQQSDSIELRRNLNRDSGVLSSSTSGVHSNGSTIDKRGGSSWVLFPS